MRQLFYVLFGWLFTVAAAYSLGHLLLRRIRVQLEAAEHAFFSFTAGSAVLSGIMFILCATNLARKGVLLALGLAAIAFGFRVHWPKLSKPWWPLLPFGAFGVVYLVKAMAPEASPDGVTYHLGLVSHAYRNRGFSWSIATMYEALSQAMELLFLFAYAFGRHSAAALVHFSFLLALPCGMVLWARRFGLSGAGWVAAFLVFASPVVGVTGVSAYNDVAVACVLFATFYALELWRVEALPGMLVVAGLLAGFGYGLKYTAAVGLIFAIGYVLWFGRRIRHAMVVAAFASLLIAPWMIRNAVTTGNPVAPFFNTTFSNPYFDPQFERIYKRDMREFNGVKLHEAWREATIDGGRLGGLLGPIFLLTPVACLAVFQREGRRLLIPAVMFALPYFANISTRFLIPPLPFLALAMAIPLMRVPAIGIGVAVVHAVLSWPGVIESYSHPYAWRIADFPLRAALRRIPEETYLAQQQRGYILARLMEAEVPPGARIFEFNNWISEAYTGRAVVVSFQSALGRRVTDILYAAINSHHYPENSFTWNFETAKLRRIRAVQKAAHDTDDWSVSEFRIYSGGVELPRLPEWRIRASHNQWRIQDAFDHSPLTRWRSSSTHRPGMWIEADLGELRQVDAVRLDCTPDQWHIEMRLEVHDGTSWRALNIAPADAMITPEKHLRAAASRELRTLGIEYVMIDDTDFFASDFNAAASLWGWKLLAQRAGVHLYKVE